VPLLEFFSFPIPLLTLRPDLIFHAISSPPVAWLICSLFLFAFASLVQEQVSPCCLAESPGSISGCTPTDLSFSFRTQVLRCSHRGLSLLNSFACSIGSFVFHALTRRPGFGLCRGVAHAGFDCCLHPRIWSQCYLLSF
jgi:hypothetical protein